ncbi:AAA family ATPase [Haliangium sp.]|uniref:AAA family ATPase n=1 Tax=Haliangium sp. TaxID=2663208 RepID=UPI003D143E80
MSAAALPPDRWLWELTPLRQADLEQAIRARHPERDGSDADDALRDRLVSTTLGPLASRPLTLDLLLDVYEHDGGLPKDTADLFEKACGRMCEDSDTVAVRTRRLGVGAPRLSADKRLVIAMRIAAVTTLCGRARVCITSGGEADDVVTPADIAGREPEEDVAGERFRVETWMVTETVAGSRLFDGTGAEFRWVHKELAEFLASRYLARHQCSLHQVLGLLAYGVEADQLIPQMEGLARWIDGVFPLELRKRVIALDPRASLRGDLQARTDDDKQLVARTLLERIATGRLFDPLEELQNYDKLAFPGLADDLAPILTNTAEPELVRRTAAAIAGRCGVLLDELARIASSGSSEPLALRKTAAHGVAWNRARIGYEPRRCMRAIIDSPMDDEERGLHGIALEVLWDARDLDVDELLEHLRPPSGLVFDAYSRFYSRPELAAEIWERADLAGRVRALRWSFEHLCAGHEADRLLEGLWQRALSELSDPEIADLITKIVAHQYEHSPTSWLQSHADTQQRRILVERLFRSEPSVTPMQLIGLSSGGLNRDDRPWLLAWLDRESDPDLVKALAECVAFFSDRDDEQERLELYERWDRDRDRYQPFGRWFAVELDSELAEWQRSDYAEQQELVRLRAARQTEQTQRTWRDDDLESAIVACVQGDAARWVEICHAMWLTSWGKARATFLGNQLVESPGWRDATPERRATLLSCAAEYLRRESPRTEAWLGQEGLVGKYAMAGLHAISVLGAAARPRLDALAPDELRPWVPVLMQPAADVLDRGVRDAMAARLARPCRAEVQATMETVLDSEEFVSFHRWHAWWSPELIAPLRERWRREPLSEHKGRMTDFLVTHAPEEMQLDLDDLLASPLADGAERRHLGTICHTALRSNATHFWPSIQRLLEQAPALVTDIFREDPPLDALPLDALDWLYRWLHEHGPRPRVQRSAQHPAVYLPLEVRKQLVHRAREESWEAVSVLRALAQAFPEDGYLPNALMEAEHVARAATWMPPTPRQLLALAGDPARWWILHGTQLRAAVLAILRDHWDVEPSRFWARVPGDAHEPVSRAEIVDVLREELAPRLARAVVDRDPRLLPTSDRTLRIDSGVGPEGTPLLVDIVVVPSWELPESIIDADVPDVDVPKIWLDMAFAGRAWTRRSDHERRGRSLRYSADDRARTLQRAAARRSAGAQADIVVCHRETRLDESTSALRALPWGDRLLDRLADERIEIQSVCSIADDQHWHVQVRWPDSLQDRFGLAPSGLMLVGHGATSSSQLIIAQDALSLAPGIPDGHELDPSLLVIVDDAPDLDARIDRQPGRDGQWVPWAAPELPDVVSALSRGLGRYDIFDSLLPARGRQFFGRGQDRAELSRRLMRGESVGIFGLRKLGKTSLARAVTDALDPISMELSLRASPNQIDVNPRAFVVWRDVQSIITEEELWRELLERVRERLLRADIQPPSDGRDVFETLEHTLRTAITAAPPATEAVCVVLDEYDTLFEAKVPVLRLLRMFRALAQEHGRLSLVFIGRDNDFLSAEHVEGHPNPMRAWVHDHWLHGLASAEADELLINLGKRVGLTVGDATRAHAYRWTGGHPALLRQFGSALLEVARAEREHASDIETDRLDLEVVAERFLERGKVEEIQDEVFGLIRARYPRAHALLSDLIRCDSPAEMSATIRRHGGWHDQATRVLRRFGHLSGSLRQPSLLPWVVWYGREVLGLGRVGGDRQLADPLQLG